MMTAKQMSRLRWLERTHRDLRFLLLALLFSIPSVAQITAIRAGAANVFVLADESSWFAWGSNAHGVLGLGDIHAQFEPLTVPSAGILQIESGQAHTCLLNSSNQVYCWGLNTSFQLGLGVPDSFVSKVDAGKPLRLGSGTIEKLVLGPSHSCALFKEGKLKCWGKNNSGQLGIGKSVPSVGGDPSDMGDALPFVNVGEVVADVVLGLAHTCVIVKSGRVKCWGASYINGTGADIGSEPSQMGGNLLPINLGTSHEKVIQLAAGFQHMCALSDSGGVKCWGKNHHGVLGVGQAVTEAIGDSGNELGAALAETKIEPGLKAKMLSCGHSHCCAALENQGVKCWGRNYRGQLGVGDKRDRGAKPTDMGINLPYVNLGTTERVRALSLGGAHSCVLLESGRLKCWGANSQGQLGRQKWVISAGVLPNQMGKSLPFIQLP